MPMFDDPNKELQKLQEQLLKEEEWFARELDSAKEMIGDAPVRRTKPAAPRQQKPLDQTQVFRTEGAPKAAPKVPKAAPKAAPKKPAAPVVRNTEDSELKLDQDTKKKDSKAVPQKKKKKSNKGLIILASLETLGIVGVVVYWLIFLL